MLGLDGVVHVSLLREWSKLIVERREKWRAEQRRAALVTLFKRQDSAMWEAQQQEMDGMAVAMSDLEMQSASLSAAPSSHARCCTGTGWSTTRQ